MADKEPKNTINLAGTMPPTSLQGLTNIITDLIKDPGRRRVAVCEFYGLYDKLNSDDGTHQIVVKWTAIEPLEGDDEKAAAELLASTRSARTGELRFTGPLDPDPADA